MMFPNVPHLTCQYVGSFSQTLIMDLVAEYLEGGELFERIVEKETVSNMYCSFL